MQFNLIEQPVTTVRVYSHVYREQEKRKLFLDLIKKYPGIDEIWLSSLHGNEAMEKHLDDAKLSASVAEELRKAGIKVSMQLSACLGHFSGQTFPDGFQPAKEDLMIDINGVSDPGVCCMTSKAFQDWTAGALLIYCREIRPEAVYIDDDVRFQNHGCVQDGCFCQRCLERFAEFTGRKWSREELAAALNSDEIEPVRLEWIDFHSKIIAEFLYNICSTVNKEVPGIHFGLQTNDCSVSYNGWTFVPCYKALAEATGLGARVRIGGGPWNDHDPRTLLGKSLLHGADAADAKNCGYVDLLTQEIENCPCNASSKSLYGMMLEAAMGMAYGATSTTFQTGQLWFYGGDEYMDEFFQKLSAARPFLARLAEISRNSRVLSLNVAYDKQFAAAPVMENQADWVVWYTYQLQDIGELMQMGIPVSMDRSKILTGDCPSVINKETAWGIDEQTFRKCFQNGVILTGDAFLALQKRNITDFTGVSARRVSSGCAKMLQHELNGEYCGAEWGWLEWVTPAVGFNFGTDSKAVALAEYTGADDYKTACWILETEAGKMAVLGAPGGFGRQYNTAQLEMLRNMCDRVGKQSLPARLSGYAPIVIVPAISTENEGRLLALTMLNSGIEVQKDIKVILRRPAAGKLFWQTFEDAPVELQPVNIGNDETAVIVPQLNAWQIGVIFYQ